LRSDSPGTLAAGWAAARSLPMAVGVMEALPIFNVCTAAHCFDVEFHPSEPLLATATITGDIELHRFDTEGGSAELVRTLKNHKESCRTARFMPGCKGTPAGARLASAAANGFAALSDVETGERLWRTKLEAGGNALLPLSGNRFAVGDDEGSIAVFDVRKKKPVAEWTEHSDFVSDLAVGGPDNQTLCATSGDGHLGVYDLRKSGTKGLIAMSDFLEDEYLCLTVLRHGTKVICGGQEGVLAIFTWGDFGDMKDRIKGPKLSIDSLVKITEDCILTGSSDGKIRVVSVYNAEHNNWILGNFAEHSDTPIERLALSPDGELVASASHGQPAVRVFSTEVAHKMLNAKKGATGGLIVPEEDEEDSDSDEEKPKRVKRKKKRRKNMVSDVQRQAAGFFSEL